MPCVAVSIASDCLFYCGVELAFEPLLNSEQRRRFREGETAGKAIAPFQVYGCQKIVAESYLAGNFGPGMQNFNLKTPNLEKFKGKIKTLL